jgi:hypothetical protein
MGGLTARALSLAAVAIAGIALAAEPSPPQQTAQTPTVPAKTAPNEPPKTATTGRSLSVTLSTGGGNLKPVPPETWREMSSVYRGNEDAAKTPLTFWVYAPGAEADGVALTSSAYPKVFWRVAKSTKIKNATVKIYPVDPIVDAAQRTGALTINARQDIQVIDFRQPGWNPLASGQEYNLHLEIQDDAGRTGILKVYLRRSEARIDIGPCNGAPACIARMQIENAFWYDGLETLAPGGKPLTDPDSAALWREVETLVSAR